MSKSKKKHSPHSRKTNQRKHSTIISQKQNVHVHLHKQRARATVRTPKSVVTPMVIPFVPPLPMNHPFNTNVPQSAVSATVPVNPNPPPMVSLFPSGPSTPAPSAPPTPYGTSPHTPQSGASAHTPHASPSPHFSHSSPIPQSGPSTPAGKKKGKALFPTLPSITEEYDNLGSLTVKQLKAMAKKENIKAHIPINIKKDKLISLLQNHHAQTATLV